MFTHSPSTVRNQQHLVDVISKTELVFVASFLQCPAASAELTLPGGAPMPRLERRPPLRPEAKTVFKKRKAG